MQEMSDRYCTQILPMVMIYYFNLSCSEWRNDRKRSLVILSHDWQIIDKLATHKSQSSLLVNLYRSICMKMTCSLVN